MLVLLFNLLLSLFVLVLCYLAVVAIVRGYSGPKKLERETRSEVGSASNVASPHPKRAPSKRGRWSTPGLVHTLSSPSLVRSG